MSSASIPARGPRRRASPRRPEDLRRWPGAPIAGGSGRAGAVIDVPVRSTARSGASYRAGARVFHQKFGYGEVVAVDGDKLDIDFDKAGAKKVMARFRRAGRAGALTGYP